MRKIAFCSVSFRKLQASKNEYLPPIPCYSVLFSLQSRTGRHRVARRWSRECDGTPGLDEKHIGTPVRGDIMRSVNIHDIFIKTQCMNNKNITTRSIPLCHPYRSSALDFVIRKSKFAIPNSLLFISDFPLWAPVFALTERSQVV